MTKYMESYREVCLKVFYNIMILTQKIPKMIYYIVHILLKNRYVPTYLPYTYIWIRYLSFPGAQEKYAILATCKLLHRYSYFEKAMNFFKTQLGIPT